MINAFQGQVVEALNNVDVMNQDLLSSVITAANEVSDATNLSDAAVDGNSGTVTDADGNVTDGREAGSIQWGGTEAMLSGTGGVALLEFAKDIIQTVASNVTGVGTEQKQVRTLVERKLGALG